MLSPLPSSLPPSLFWPQADRVRAREAAEAMAASAALRLRMIIILDVCEEETETRCVGLCAVVSRFEKRVSGTL
ncbi:hypothetical protein GCM10018772_02050 [Streptomyces fumanus]|uniref:Uncharacterized protein n=1 Tax=Streptomyces fumanus TaxID=67302 RepID=A0A919A1V1_9ACTN|nr:hypothetical protein GCM10018772_02050 [Streptomyces fumanus]